MIFTFYSYKGGVGRSMALANVGELFYQAGYRVLVVDWDLEAPGLERFFPLDQKTAVDQPGVINLLQDFKTHMSQELPESDAESESLPFTPPDNFIIDVYPNEDQDGKLWLLTAGRRSGSYFAEYANAVTTFDWHDFYLNWDGELYFEWLRQQFLELADVILIDSRTGVTEMGGVCTYQLADTVVMLCAANEQNLDGTYELAKNFQSPEVQAIRHDRLLNVLIIPSRIERAEGDLLDKFHVKFTKMFADLVPELPGMDVKKLWQLGIPYIPKYAYTEEVAVRESDRASAEDMVKAYQAIQTTLAQLIQKETAEQIELTPGTILRQRYHITAPLLEGGTSTMYRAEDKETGRQVAIKAVPITSSFARGQLDLLGNFMMRLDHPHIVRTLDYFYDDESQRGLFVVMEFVEGVDLREVVSEFHTLPESLVIHWALQLCAALDYLHQKSPAIVHRDIKPSNIKIRDGDENIVLVDFGIAAVHEPERLEGNTGGITPGFSPPEQYEKNKADTRSDIYALGATLYTLLAGQPPATAPNRLQNETALIPLRDLNPSVSLEVEKIIDKALALDMYFDRYQTIGRLQEDLESWVDKAPASPPVRLSDLQEKKPQGYLFLFENGRFVNTIQLTEQTYVIGRSPELEIPINSKKVSRRHAQINCQLDGVFVEDLQSTNGTFVNKERLPPLTRQQLEEGDRITFGDCELRFTTAAPKYAEQETLFG